MTKDETFNFLNRVAEGISIMFGSNCETVIHEITDNEFINVAIYNGHVSGRVAGSKVGILDKNIYDNNQIKVDTSKDSINQLVVINNKTLKSSTFFYYGEDYTYALGINYDISLMKKMSGFLDNFTETSGNLFYSLSSNDSQLDVLFKNSLSLVNKSIENMKKHDRLSLVKILMENNFFDLQKSVPYLSEKLDVSKYTIYKYINEIESEIF